MAEVSQRFIDLLNVPLAQLRAAAEAEKIKGAKSMRKWDLADKLASRPRAQLEKLAAGYLYAGQTSMSWIRLEDTSDAEVDDADAYAEQQSAHLRGAPLDEDAVREILNEMSEGGNAFSEAARPAEVTRDPQLVVAHSRDDGAIVLSFAVLRSVGHVIRNFEAREILTDDFFNVVLHPDQRLVEVRTSQQIVGRFIRTWLADFADRFVDLWIVPASKWLDRPSAR